MKLHQGQVVCEFASIILVYKMAMVFSSFDPPPPPPNLVRKYSHFTYQSCFSCWPTFTNNHSFVPHLPTILPPPPPQPFTPSPNCILSTHTHLTKVQFCAGRQSQFFDVEVSSPLPTGHVPSVSPRTPQNNNVPPRGTMYAPYYTSDIVEVTTKKQFSLFSRATSSQSNTNY